MSDLAVSRPSRRRMILWVIGVLVGVQVLLPALFHLGRNRLIFLPSRGADPANEVAVFGGDVTGGVVHVERPDGRRLTAYDVRPENDETADTDPVVLYFHGNAGDLASRAGLVAHAVRYSGLRWLAIDYSGYGINEGAPSEREVEKDALAAFDHLVAQGVAAERVMIYGQSLGGAVAAYLATERPVAGVVVQSTFSSASDMSQAMFPWLPLGAVYTRSVFPTARRLAGLDCPVLVVHGERDRVIPVEHGERLHAAAPDGTEFLRVPRAGHNDVFATGGPEFLRRVGETFREWARRDR